MKNFGPHAMVRCFFMFSLCCLGNGLEATEKSEQLKEMKDETALLQRNPRDERKDEALVQKKVMGLGDNVKTSNGRVRKKTGGTKTR